MFKRCFSPKTLSAGSVSTSAMVPPTRRPFSSKEGQKTEKTREKNKTSSGKSNSGASTSSNGKSSLLMSRRSKENVYKSKAENDKSSMENKIKDLMALAKSKDSEIKSLKTKLDHMMLLLNKQQEDDSTVTTSSPKGEFTSLVKLSHEDGSEDASVGEMQMELAKLQDENMQLREQVDAMMLSMKSKEPVVDKALYTGTCQQSQTQAELDTFSNDDGLSSSLDDLASATSGDAARSASVSRSASTENLLDDVSTGGMTSSNPQNGCRGDDKSHEDGTSETSSVTVACLTERIHRMEESHISTHEELEATVQELTDLQKSVPELTIDNSRLKDEKDYLVKQLSIAEKKLTDQAAESKHLKTLLSDHLNEGSNHTDLKQQYVVLLNEREQLLQIQESVSKELQVAVNERKESQDLVEAFQERMRHLERELTQSNTEKSLLNKKLKEMKDLSEEQKEVVHRLRTDLNDEHLRLESLYKLPSGSQERSELVEGLKKENQELKENCLLLEEDFTQCQSENKILDARVAELEEEQEATDTQNKKDLSELSELIDRLQEDLRVKQASLDEANDTLFVMEDSVEQHIAVKKHDNHIIQRYQEQVSELKEERFRLEKEIQQLKKEQRNQSEEWKQFQADLQMAVIIANDMKAETQSEVARLREDNQMLDETVTKLRVENEQLRRKRISNVSATSASILEAAAMRQAASRTSVDISALRESYKRRASENSPGVQSLIKSFDNPSNDPANPLSPDISQNLMSGDITSAPFSPVKSQAEKLGGNITRTDSSPITATVSPVQRHHSISSITQFTPSPQTTNSSNKLQQNSGSGTSGRDKPDTSYSGKTNGSPGDVQQFSHLLRNSDKQEARKPSSDSRKQPLTDILDHLGNGAKAGRRGTLPTTTRSTPPSARTRSMSVSGSSNDPLASLARRYGGSKRNALLKWCQEKTRNYHDIDITNFSSSWSDGLALCGLLHSYLPAHIPYDSLQQTYAAANDDKTRIQLQAKNFRLAFAAAESVGIEPALTTDEMTTKERPDWQRVMTYVTEIYKYFET